VESAYDALEGGRVETEGVLDAVDCVGGVDVELLQSDVRAVTAGGGVSPVEEASWVTLRGLSGCVKACAPYRLPL
jgi:hypothetical protein